MNQIKETIKPLQIISEDELFDLFIEMDCKETAILIRGVADYYLRIKAQEEAEELADECCEKEWIDTDNAQRIIDIKGE